GGLLQPPVALCLTENLAPLFARRNRTLHAWHQRLPLLPSRWRMVGASTAETGVSLRKPRFRFDDFFVKLWLFIAWRRRTLPPAVTLNRFLTLLDVFVFGIFPLDPRVSRRGQHHHHVATVEKRLRLDLTDLLDVLRQAHQQVATALGMRRLPPPEHDRHLH